MCWESLKLARYLQNDVHPLVLSESDAVLHVHDVGSAGTIHAASSVEHVLLPQLPPPLPAAQFVARACPQDSWSLQSWSD